jgi:YD repeat-containing protein
MLSTLKVSAFSLVALMVLNTSCTKDKAAGVSGRQKLKSYTEDITAQGIGHVVETFNVNYDGQERITSIVSTTKPGHRLEYKYISNDKFTFEQIEDNKLMLHCDYFINAEVGKVDSLYQYNIKKDTTAFKYFYDKENRILKQKEYLMSYLLPPVWYNTIDYVYDTKGTLTKKVESFAETSYRYDEEFKSTILLEPGYIPSQEKLPSHTYSVRFSITTTTEHFYTYDGQGRLASEKAVASDGNRQTITIRTYTYL